MLSVSRLLVSLASLALVASTVTAQERLGTVHFQTSCNPAAAPRFDRAVAWLHSFEFRESIRAFNDVLAADSSCAMAYWGIAMSRWGNPMAPGTRSPSQLRPGQEAADAALRVSARASERERLYIAAVSELYKDYEHVDQGKRVLRKSRPTPRQRSSMPSPLPRRRRPLTKRTPTS
jgi:hypothetical protein